MVHLWGVGVFGMSMWKDIKKWKSLDTGWLSKSEMVDVQDSSGRDGKGRIDKRMLSLCFSG